MKTSLWIPESFKPEGPHRDKLALLANTLAYRTLHKKEDKQDGWISFGKDDWKRNVAKSYGKIREAAIEQNLIEWNQSYSNSEQNPYKMSVKLTKQHRNGDLKHFILRRKPRAKECFRIAEEDSVGHWLASKMRGFHFPDDFDAEPLAESLNSLRARNSVRLSSERIEKGNLFASRCRYGRFHSNFTSMKKSLRQNLLFNNKPLVEIDIKNSQPFLMPQVIRDHICGEDYVESCIYYNINCSCLIKELKDFSSLVESGIFYESLSKETYRSIVKNQFFKSLYSKNHSSKKSPIFQQLQMIFPRICDVIIDIKKEDHAVFAQLLQKIESTIVIDGACAALMKEEPGIPIVTIHDSIITTEDYAELAQQELEKAFTSRCGMIPKLRVEKYCEM